MKPTKISYQQVRNTGNYENIRIEVEVEINEGETVADAVAFAKEQVQRALYPEDFRDL